MTTPTPPPGYEILTDYTKPLPERAMFWNFRKAPKDWQNIQLPVQPPNSDYIYAIPITQTEKPHPATGEKLERQSMNHETETIDRLFLELSQFTKAQTSRELTMRTALEDILNEKENDQGTTSMKMRLMAKEALRKISRQ